MEKLTGRRTALRAKHVAVAVAAAFAPWAHGQTPPPNTLPTGGVITHGSGTINAPVHTPTLSTMQIDQTSARMAAQFGSFSIGQSAHVNVSQPSSSSVALFKDVGGSLSQIYGGLTANGHIFISNQNGVLFGSTARVEVGSLFATNLSINETDFMEGRYNWYNDGATGTVTNQGTIITPSGYTVLAGPQVRNDGLIIARTGTVVLAAGDRVALDLIGDGLISVNVDGTALKSAVNTGTIEAEGGTVMLTARNANALLDTVVNAGGVIRATSLVERNGEIVLDGGNAGLVNVAGSLQAGSASVSGANITMSGTIVTDLGSGSQTITTPGSLSIQAGGGVGQNAGLIHNGSGEQKVSAGNLSLMGGNSGSNNQAVIESKNAAADQAIHTAGGMQVSGGNGGDNNQAIVRSAGNQRIDVGATLGVEGGAFSGPIGNNTALVVGGAANVPGKKQIINAGSIIVRSGAGGFQNGGVIVAPRQEITTTGDLLLAGGGTGGQLGGVRMGGLSTGAGGAANTATDLTLNVGNDLLLSGGAAPTNSANIGSTIGQPQTVTVNAARDIIVGASPTSAARIGTVTGSIPSNGTPGNISLTAGRDIRVNGGGEIVTTGTVTLNAANGAVSVNATSPTAGNARIASGSGQDIQAQSLSLTSQFGRQAQLINSAVGEQTIKAETVDIQTVGPVGGLAEIRNNSTADQKLTVSGDHLTVRALGGGSATIFGNGNQTIDMTRSGPKSITLGDHAALGSSTITSNGDQKVLGYADITMTGGSGLAVPGGSNALIVANNPARTQRIEAGTLAMANSNLGGNSSVAAILGANQSIHAVGNVTLTANASGGTLPGVRIGGLSGPGSTATNLTLTAGGDLLLTGGSVTNNGVGIGTTAAPPPGAVLANNITIDAGGSVILTSGTADGTGARIGSSGNAAVMPGDIRIAAGGAIALNGTAQPTSIRTLGDVTLNAASISEASNGVIVANTLKLTSAGDALLNGANQVAALSAPSVAGVPLPLTRPGVGGNLAFTNAGALNLSDLSVGGSLTLNNTGAVAVTNAVTSNGAMNLNVAGDLAVSAGGTQDATLRAFGGQAISARSLAVTSSDGRFASVSNSGGAQTIDLSNGSGLDVRTQASGGFAQISNDGGGSQTISVVNGDHINVDGIGGVAGIFNFGGTQSLSITGNGANAITLGAPGSFGPSQVIGGVQSVTAGTGSQSGSITITGGNGNATFTGFSSGQIAGGTQTVSTSGTLRINGGEAPNQPVNGFATGLFHNGSGEQKVNAANLAMQGGASGLNNLAIIISSGGAGTIPAGDQVIDVGSGNISLAGGSGGNNTAIIVSFADQTVDAGSVALRGGAAGSGNGAFINSSFGGDQTLTVPGTISVTGGSGGVSNRAGIVTNANQTINGNPDIFIAGGNGGSGNNVFIQATGGDTKLQTINARNVRLNAGAGTDASATFNSARQVISTTGDVSLFGSGGAGSTNGVRIGGIGGTTLGPTNLTLGVGGNLLLHGGTANSANLGSSGPSTQSNNITVTASGNVILQSDGADARIGTSNLVPVTSGNIAVTAGGSLQLADGTAIRVNGPITLTANSLTNAGTITNGGGANTANVILNANAFDLADGNIQGGAAAVALRPRTGTNSFGIESAGATTISNADIASIQTDNFIIFGSSTATIFTGNMTIGENARVEGNGRNLAFSRSLTPSAEMIIIGSQGVATTGDVIMGAGGGGIRSNGGTVTGDEVVLRASNGIGTPGARVKTAANALALNNVGGGGVFVSELDNVTLRTISLNAGGPFTVSNTNNGSFSLISGGDVNVAGVVTSGSMILDAGGNLKLDATSVDAELRSFGGQTIGAQTINLTAENGRRAIIQNQGGLQELTARSGGMDLQVGGAAGVAQIVNISSPFFLADQTINAAGQLNVLGGATAGGSTNSGIFQNGTGLQKVTAAGITLQGASSGTNAGAGIRSQGDQLIDVSGDINLRGGNGGTNNNAFLSANPTTPGAAGKQTIYAHNINLSNGVGGVDTSATITAGKQVIDVTGNVTLTSQGALLGTAPGGPGVRIGAPGGTPLGTDLTLLVDGHVTLNGGAVAENGASIGSSGATIPATPNTIRIEAGGNVILNAGTLPGTGVRIGSGSGGTAGGNIRIDADGRIELNGTDRSAAIRTLGNVTLDAASIVAGSNGFVLADTLTTTSSGATSLAGPNEIARFSGTSGSDLTLNNSGALEVTGLSAGGNAMLTNAGNVTVTGPWSAGGSSHISAHSDLVLGALLTSAGVTLEADGLLTEFGMNGVGAVVAGTLTTRSGGSTFFSGENRVASYSGTSGADLNFFNRGDLTVTGLSASTANLSNNGAVAISGPWVTAAQTNITAFGGPGATLSETPGGFIQAAGFNGLSADGSVSLNGPNRISGTLFGSSMQGDFRLTNAGDLNFGVFASFGDVNLMNAGVLNVTSLGGRNVAVTNTGPMTISGFWSSNGTTAITTAGAASDLTVNNTVTSQGAMTIDVDGTLTVAASGLQVIPPPPGLPPLSSPQFAALQSFGGQSITAGSVHVSAQDGAFAQITNGGSGNQTINVSGGGIEVRSAGAAQSGAPSSSAQIGNFTTGSQTITVSGAGGVNLSSTGGFASISNSGSAQTIDVAGGALTVAASGVQAAPPPPPGFPPAGPLPNFASLTSSGGQAITARSVHVSAQDGAVALINNQGAGNQALTVSGGGIEIRSSGGAPSGPGSSSAQIGNFSTGSQTIAVAGGSGIDVLASAGNASINQGAGPQTILVTNADHISLNGAGGNAVIFANGGTQTVSITGSGANAIALGSATGRGFSGIVNGSAQTVTAGGEGERGSITIVGGEANGATGSIVSRTVGGGMQNVTTSGLLSITGGSAPSQTNSAGIFHNGSGEQKVSAARIELQGGASGNNNGALIVSGGAGVPANAGAQNINVNGDLVIAGGAGGNAGITGPATRLQTIRAANIHMTNSAAGGFNSVGFILGGHQNIGVTGDLTMTARASGGDLPGVRIGGLSGAAATATDLVLTVGDDLVLTGGTVAGNGVGIGSTAAPGPAFANNITIDAGADVILNSGVAGAAVRIGSSATTGAAGGDINITAGGDIRLNGVAENAAIRTLGNVTLDAASISEAEKGRIEAATLHTRTSGDALLTGPNRVSAFTAETDHGNVHLTNTSALLTLGSMDLPGNLAIVQTGDVAMGNASATQATLVAAAGDISMSASGQLLVRGSDTTSGASGAVLAGGELNFSAGNVALIGGSAAGSFAQITGHGPIGISAGGNVSLMGGSGDGAFARILGYSDINLTVGGFITLAAGSGVDSWARIQTVSRDSVITLNFPNLASGGYFVNGIEGLLRDGHTGFLSDNGVAAPGHQLITIYGAP